MDCQICKTFCTKAFCILNQRIDLLSRHSALSFCVDTADRTAIFQRALEHNKLAVLYYIRYVFQLHAETQIRLIGTETIHCLAPGHTLDRKLQIVIADLLEELL